MSRRCSKSVVCGFAVLALWTSAPASAADLSGAFAPIGVVTGPLIKAIIAAAAAFGAAAKTVHDHRSKPKEPSAG